MDVGVSIFLIAVGAILTFAVDVRTQGANLNTIGVILMVIGAVGLLASMLLWGDRAPLRRRDRYVTGDRETIRDREYL